MTDQTTNLPTLPKALADAMQGLFGQTDHAKLRTQFGEIAAAARSIADASSYNLLAVQYCVGAATEHEYWLTGGKRDDDGTLHPAVPTANKVGWAAIKRAIVQPGVLTDDGGDDLRFHGYSIRSLSRCWDVYRSNAPMHWEAFKVLCASDQPADVALRETAPTMFAACDASTCVAYSLALLDGRIKGGRVLAGSNRIGTAKRDNIAETRTAAEVSQERKAAQVARGEVIVKLDGKARVAGRITAAALNALDDDGLDQLIADAIALRAARKAAQPAPAVETPDVIAAQAAKRAAPKGSRPAKRVKAAQAA